MTMCRPALHRFAGQSKAEGTVYPSLHDRANARTPYAEESFTNKVLGAAVIAMQSNARARAFAHAMA